MHPERQSACSRQEVSRKLGHTTRACANAAIIQHTTLTVSETTRLPQKCCPPFMHPLYAPLMPPSPRLPQKRRHHVQHHRVAAQSRGES